MPFNKITKLLYHCWKAVFLWNCRRNQIKPKIKGYQNKIAKKYETEHKIKEDYFGKNWIFNSGQKSN